MVCVVGELQKSTENGFIFRVQEDSAARLGRMKFNGDGLGLGSLM